jgi:hypothetical protein
MERNDPSSPARWPLPLGLIGLLGLVAGIERFVVRRDYAFSSFHVTSWKFTPKQLNWLIPGRAKASAADSDRGPQMFIFGDSLVKYGVYPHVIRKLTGMNAYNLAMCSGPTPASYFLFRRVLERGGKPRVILIDTAETVLDAGPRSRVRPYAWSDLLTTVEVAELAWTMRDFDFLVQNALNAALHSLKNRFEIRQNIQTTLKGEQTSLRVNTLGLLRNWAVNRGAQVMPKVVIEEKKPPPPIELPGTWAADPINCEYLERLFDLARRNDVGVFWLLPPYSPFVQQVHRYRGQERRFLGFVRSMHAKHPEVVVVDGRNSGYDRTRFMDDSHLNWEGGTVLSATLTDEIILYLDDPKSFPTWCKLPAFRETDPGAPREDFSLSRTLAPPSVLRR